MSTTWSACGASSTDGALVPQPILRPEAADDDRRDLLRLHQPGHGRGLARCSARAPTIRCGYAPSRSPTRCRVHRAHERCSSSSRTRCADAYPAGQRAATSTRRKLVRVLHYDGTPITARFISARIGNRIVRIPGGWQTQIRRWPHDLSRQTQTAAPRHAEEQGSATPGATTRAAFRRCAPAAATIRSRRDHPGLLRAGHRAAPRAKLSGIGCSSKTPDYFLGAPRTASTPCTAACPRC